MGVWGGLEVLPIFIIIQGGLRHPLCQAARSGIGGDTHCQGELGHGVRAWGQRFPTVAPQRHVGWGAAGVSAPTPMTWHPGVVPGAAP